jgi:hypothetical protein
MRPCSIPAIQCEPVESKTVEPMLICRVFTATELAIGLVNNYYSSSNFTIVTNEESGDRRSLSRCVILSGNELT